MDMSIDIHEARLKAIVEPHMLALTEQQKTTVLHLRRTWLTASAELIATRGFITTGHESCELQYHLVYADIDKARCVTHNKTLKKIEQ